MLLRAPINWKLVVYVGTQEQREVGTATNSSASADMPADEAGASITPVNPPPQRQPLPRKPDNISGRDRWRSRGQKQATSRATAGRPEAQAALC